MAKLNQGQDGKPVNKSAAIRETISQNPHAQSKEIVSLLEKKGIKVRPTLVYYIKSKQGQQRRRQKRELVRVTSQKTGSSNPVELILKVKHLATEAGGIKSLKQLVDALAD
jgi:hypothetical protein